MNLKVSCAMDEHCNPEEAGHGRVLDIAAVEHASPPAKRSLREENIFANSQSKEMQIL